MWFDNIFYYNITLFCTAFFVLGSKPSGMAGAYVSVEDDNMAFYWNPAKYTLNETTSFEIPLGVEIIATNDIVKELNDVEREWEKEVWSYQLIVELEDLKKEKMGLLINIYGGVSLQFKNYGLSIMEHRHASGNPFFDKMDSTLQIKYINIREYIFSHKAKNFLFDNLYLGSNLKILVGQLDYVAPKVLKEKDVEKKVAVTLKGKQAQTTTKLGLDIGLLYQKNNLSYGLVIKNLNSPKFSFPESASLEDYQLKQQIRAGVSFKTNKNVILAVDCDVTKNDTLLKGYQSQNLFAGIEYPLYNPYLVLRCGWMKNLSENDIGNVYSLGFGLNFLHLQADIASAISGKKTKRDKTGEKFPVNLIGSVQLSGIF